MHQESSLITTVPLMLRESQCGIIRIPTAAILAPNPGTTGKIPNIRTPTPLNMGLVEFESCPYLRCGGTLAVADHPGGGRVRTSSLNASGELLDHNGTTHVA